MLKFNEIIFNEILLNSYHFPHCVPGLFNRSVISKNRNCSNKGDNIIFMCKINNFVIFTIVILQAKCHVLTMNMKETKIFPSKKGKCVS